MTFPPTKKRTRIYIVIRWGFWDLIRFAINPSPLAENHLFTTLKMLGWIR